MSAAVLLATAPGSEGGPAAGLPWEDTTLLGRLVAQLAALGVGEFHVVTRPAWSGDLERSLASAGVAARMHRSEDRAGDLRAVAAIAGGSGEDALVVANADVLTQGEALAGLLADPRVATGVLVATRQLPRPTAFRIRGRRGVVLAAGTPYHVVGPTTGTFLGVLKIAARDRAAAADVAQRVAELLDGSLPAGWSDEFEAKVARWRLVLQRHGARGDAPEDGSDEEEQAPADAVELAPEAEAELARRVGAAEQDVTALLLHGLVRSAVRVGTSHLRRLFWARPLSRDDVDLAASRIGEHSEEEALLESAVKANDGFFTTFFVSPYSKYIAVLGCAPGMVAERGHGPVDAGRRPGGRRVRHGRARGPDRRRGPAADRVHARLRGRPLGAVHPDVHGVRRVAGTRSSTAPRSTPSSRGSPSAPPVRVTRCGCWRPPR